MYIFILIRLEVISRYHNNLLAGYFRIEKTEKLITRKYYWLMLQRHVEAYIKSCDVCMALKTIKSKPYGDFRSLLIPTHWCKDLSIDFVIGVSISAK